MQNALRAKNSAITEAQRAQVKSEDEWQVPSSVREAWGITGESQAMCVYAERIERHIDDITQSRPIV